MKITRRIIYKYLENSDDCPFCDSGPLNADNNNITPETNVLWRNVSCENCNREWTEEFQLTLIDNLIEHETN